MNCYSINDTLNVPRNWYKPKTNHKIYYSYNTCTTSNNAIEFIVYIILWVIVLNIYIFCYHLGMCHFNFQVNNGVYMN